MSIQPPGDPPRIRSMLRTWLRRSSLVLIAIGFTAAGINHFRDPALYLAMMPSWLPWPEALNLISGAAEVAGGLGVLPRATRRAAGWGLIALLVAIFPANLQMLSTGFPGADLPAWVLWVRLPLQPLAMAWVWWACVRRREDDPARASRSVAT